MRLRRPTDFLILEALANYGRNVAPNLAAHTGKSRQHVSTRLSALANYGLVKKIGPAKQSGLYELTSLGKAALVHRDRYGDVDDFEAVIRNSARSTDPTLTDAGLARCGDDEGDGESS